MSRATISSSASAGWPGMPRRLDHSPSCMWPPPQSAASSQCWASTTAESPTAYSMARRISRLSCTPEPSSVKSRTPRSAISAIGASCSPARPTVMAPAGCTSHSGLGARGPAPRGPPRRESMAGVGVGHGDDRGEPAERGGTGCRSRRSRPPPGPAGAGGRAGRPGRGRRRSPPASSTRVARRGRRRPRRCGRRRRPRRRRAPRWRRPPDRPDDDVIGPLQAPATRRRPALAPVRGAGAGSAAAAGTAPPCARPHRCAPGRRSPTAGRSATSGAISTPRFIGPGCMTMASGPQPAGPAAR